MPMYRVRTQLNAAQGGPYLNTLYFDTAGGTAQQAVAAAAAFWGSVDNRLDNSITWSTEPTVDTINEATGALTASTGTESTSGVGAVPGSVLPFASQGLVRLLTSGIVGGRRVRGRIFVPGIVETDATEGLLEVAARNAFDVSGAALIADLNSVLVVWSRPRAADPTAQPPVTARAGSMHVVSSAATWNQFAVLRSRRD